AARAWMDCTAGPSLAARWRCYEVRPLIIWADQRQALRARRQSEQDNKRATRPRGRRAGNNRMNTFPDRFPLPARLVPAAHSRAAFHEYPEGPHEKNVGERDSTRGVARSTG